jgi:hypothetical protein
MGPKPRPTIWHTYMKLVTKYQISVINSCWEKCDEKYLGRTEGRTKVKQYTPSPFGERGYNNSEWVDISLYSDTLSWFWANQLLLLLINAACLMNKQQIPIFYKSLVWPDQDSNPWSFSLFSPKMTS